MRTPSKKEMEMLRKLANKGALTLPMEALRKVLPCDGCGAKPILNPKWLTEYNPRFNEMRKFILGCPSTMWGGAEVYETLREAIDNWNYHVECGGHYCVASYR